MTEERKRYIAQIAFTVGFYGVVFATLFEYTPETTLMVWYVLTGSLIAAATLFSLFWLGKVMELSIKETIFIGLGFIRLKWKMLTLKLTSQALILVALWTYGMFTLAVTGGIVFIVTMLSIMVTDGAKQEMMVLKIKGTIE